MKKRSLVVTNIIGFIAGTFIFGIAGVYAVTYFSSTNTTYDNSSSGMSSTNVQTAIDELYNVCKPSAGEQIIEDNNLQKDPYECRYFFTGENPNNYITFNNETAAWRIISVGCDNTIKIMKDKGIGDIAWNTSGSYGNNNWDMATLKTYLNEDYYNSLTSTAQRQIVESLYYTGAVTYNNNDLASQIKDENGNTWNGKIALPTLSEYIRTNSNSSCKTLSANISMYNTCKNSTWMYTSYYNDWWTLSTHSIFSRNVFIVGVSGRVSYGNASSTDYAVRPVVYLSSEVKITGGDGSQSNPYTIQ